MQFRNNPFDTILFLWYAEIMPNEVKNDEPLSPEIEDVMRNLITAIRAVKLYPPNNPIYSQSLKKTCEVMTRLLETTLEYRAGVQKTCFTYQHTPVGKDAQLNKGIAQDLFVKGIRELVFSNGVTEAELLVLCRALALSSEELAMRSGISSILWEKDATHIKVTEAGLDEVITTKMEGGREDHAAADTAPGVPGGPKEKGKAAFTGRALVLGDAKTDPTGFGAGMIALAIKTCAEHERIEDRLFALYQQAGDKIHTAHAVESDALFDGLAQSILTLEQPYRDQLIGGKLYGDLDAELAAEQEQGVESDPQLQLPNALHEIRTGRFSNAWNVQQVTTLLKRTAGKKMAPSTPPAAPSTLKAAPIPQDLIAIAKGLSEYSPEEMEALEALNKSGMESDILEAAVRTLIYLLPLVKNTQRTGPAEKELKLFAGVVRQLEDIVGYLFKTMDYDLATRIIQALHMTVDPAFMPRLAEALKKTASKTIITTTISDMRKHPKESPEYQSAHAYLSSLDRKATETLLALLAEENDRETRMFLLELLKDFGKNQISLIGEHIGDERWYVVRNIAGILGYSKTDKSIAYLRKAVDHEDVRVRQEVIKGLVSIGGKKAASVLTKFMNDKDGDLQMTAIHALADFPGISVEESKPLMEFLEDRLLKKKEQTLTLEAIKALGNIGGRDAAEFLKRYTRIRWWKPRQLQHELRASALRSIEEINKRRQGDAGRTKQ